MSATLGIKGVNICLKSRMSLPTLCNDNVFQLHRLGAELLCRDMDRDQIVLNYFPPLVFHIPLILPVNNNFTGLLPL